MQRTAICTSPGAGGANSSVPMQEQRERRSGVLRTRASNGDAPSVKSMFAHLNGQRTRLHGQVVNTALLEHFPDLPLGSCLHAVAAGSHGAAWGVLPSGTAQPAQPVSVYVRCRRL